MSKFYWGTQAEIDFIKNLGQNKIVGNNIKTSSMSKKQLLKRYIKASGNRWWWGGIDGNEAIKYAQKELRNLS